MRRVAPCGVAHIDTSVLRRMGPHYTYHRPIAVQPLRETQNSRTWCVRCDGSRLDELLRPVVRGLIRLLRLDVDPHAGFGLVYRLQRLHVLLERLDGMVGPGQVR